MNWGLLAGGVSKGLDQALQGANQGLVQGEGIRHQRAGEGMQQEQLGLQKEHFGLQREQLQNLLAQQGFQNRMARERFGLDKDQFAAQQRHQNWTEQHGDELRGIQGGEFKLKQEAFPYDRALTEAKTNYYNNPALRSAGRGGFEQRVKDAAAARLGYESYADITDPAHRAQIDKEWEGSRPGHQARIEHGQRMATRYDMLNRLAEQTLAHPRLAGEDRVTMELALSRIRNVGFALRNIQQANLMGMPPNPQDVAFVESNDMEKLHQDLVNLNRRIATRGAEAAYPGQMPQPSAPQPSGAPQGGSPLDQLLGRWQLQRPSTLR